MAARPSAGPRNSAHSLNTPRFPSPLASPLASPSTSPPTLTTAIPRTPIGSFINNDFTNAGFLVRTNTERARDRDRESVAASWAVSSRRAVSPFDGRTSPFAMIHADVTSGSYAEGSGVLVEEIEAEDDYFTPHTPGRAGRSSHYRNSSKARSGGNSGSGRDGAQSPPVAGPLLSPPLSPPLSAPVAPSARVSGRSTPLLAHSGQFSPHSAQSPQSPQSPNSPHSPRSPFSQQQARAVQLREDEQDLNLLHVDNGLYVEEDQSDAPWASYKPTISPGMIHGGFPEEDSISLLRCKMYEILDDKTYTQQQYFLQCEYGKLPNRPHIPVTLDGEHSSKAQVLLGIGNNPSVPALLWSSSQYFVRAVYSLAGAYSLTPAVIYANTARIRRDMSYMGAFVGWLPLDFGVWRGKNDLDPQRAEYLQETFPGVDEYWAFWYPLWSPNVLSKDGVTSISFGPAPSPQYIPTRLPSPEEKKPAAKMNKAQKFKRRASGCHTQ